ncbi:hypothetical protein CTI14_64355, partial [Methylobacterium radiotolerans]
IGDGVGRMSLTFFAKNVGAAEWRSKDLAVGRRGVFSGKVGEFNGMTQFAHPEYELFDDRRRRRSHVADLLREERRRGGVALQGSGRRAPR